MASQRLVEYNGPDWTYFVAISGEAGSAWVKDFSQGEPARLEAWLRRSLDLLYHHRLQDGRELLDRVEPALPKLPASAVASVLHHRFVAVLAYAYYCQEDFDGAERLLAQAHQEVQQAIEEYPFLISLANRCSDFRLQRIRISRRQRRWAEMAERVETVRRILRDELPLCVLSDGAPIHFANLIGFYDSLPDLDAAGRSAVRATFDPELRLRQFENLVRHLYVLPGFVIPYP